MDKKVLLEKLAIAKQELGAAQHVLQQIVASLEVVPRAEKTTITAVAADAFDRLRAARVAVSELEDLALSDED